MIAALAIVFGALGACSSGSDEPLSSADLWSGIGVTTAFADEPESLEQVVRDASFVVKARISKIRKGPDTVHDTSDGRVSQPSLLVDLDVSEVLDGTAPEKITVHFALITGEISATENPPADEYIWFLEPSGVEDYYMTTSFAGVVAEIDGEVTTPRDPGSSVLDPSWENLEDVEGALDSLSR